MKTKIFSLLAALLLSVSMSFGQSGTTGPLEWSIENNTLYIRGEGEMPDYEMDPMVAGLSALPPWYDPLTGISGGNIKQVFVSEGVTRISNYAFYNFTSLWYVEIPSSITHIGNNALGSCYALSSVNILNNSNLTSIGEYAFAFCRSLGEINIPSSLTSIGNRAFYECTNLMHVIFPNNSSLTSIGERAFYDCAKLSSITFPNSLTSIGYMSFPYCTSLSSVTIPNSIKSIETGAFSNCTSLTSITLPNSLETVGYQSFGYCSLTSITIPNSVTDIQAWAFIGCLNLASVIISKNVEQIGTQAFKDCSNLTKVKVEWETPLVVEEGERSPFYAVDLSQATLTVPVGTKALYKEAAVWKDFGTILEEGETPGLSPALTDLTVSSGTLSPAFDSDVLDYAISTTDDVTTITLTVDAGNGTTQTYTLTVTHTGTGTGVENVSASQVSAYPVPTKGMVNVTNAEGAEINVSNLKGESLLRTRQSSIDLSNYPNGIYLLQVGNKTIKVIKQ